jgi:branched-chain amino acid transport system ATP-binding protein
MTLAIEDLCVARGGRSVLEDVTLTVRPGEITALLGPNGAGKSTLVLAIGGVLPVASGRVAIGDVVLSGRRPERVRAAGVAIVPEGRKLLPELTVQENLVAATYLLPRRLARAEIERVVELFPELRKRWKVQARLLSGGEQQMVVLGQALAARPQYVVVDELSLGLAPAIVRRLVPTLEQVAADGIGVLLIEQFAHIALALAQQAYILEGGRVRYSGSAAELAGSQDILEASYRLT